MPSCKGESAETKLSRHEVTPDGCWLWTGNDNGRGYGVTTHGSPRRSVYVHRLAYETWIGPIPEGLQIDHLCFQRRCVNPAHLEAVTPGENNRRMHRRFGTPRRRKRADACRRGHPYDETNTYETPTGRTCRKCHALQEANRRARKEATS